jgi:hypothetical protein
MLPLGVQPPFCVVAVAGEIEGIAKRPAAISRAKNT